MSGMRRYGGLAAFLAVTAAGLVAPAAAFDPSRPSAKQAHPAPPAVSGAVSAGSETTALTPALDQALKNLEASHAVWRDNDADFRRQRASGTLSETEAGEFATYVAGLRLQVLKDCGEVWRRGGERLLEPYDCGTGGLPSGEGQQGEQTVAALPPGEAVRTEGESVDALEDALRRIEGDLDELTRRKTEEARAAGAAAEREGRNRSNDADANDSAWQPPPGSNKESDKEGRDTASGTSGSPADKPGQKDGNRQAEAESGDAIDPAVPGPQAGRERSSDRGAAAGDKDTKRKTAKVDETPGREGTDDDVLARQLREAAEKEQDPVLREKLWSEYRKYKQSQS